MRAPGCRCGTIRSSARPCRLTQAQSGSDQPSARSGEAEGGGLRKADDLVGAERAAPARRRRRRWNGSPVARTQVGRPRAGKDHRIAVRERARPGRASARRRAALQGARWRAPPMTNSARSRAARRGWRQPRTPVLADADDGQPGRRRRPCSTEPRIQRTRTHAHSHSRRHDGSLRARGASRRRSDFDVTAVARRPHQRPAPAADPDPHRRLRRRGRARPLPGAGADRGGDRRHASLRGRDVRATRPRPARSAGVPLLALRRPPGSRRPATAGSTWLPWQRPLHALGEAPRRVFLTVGRLELASFAAAPQHTYLVRTIEPIGDALPVPNVDRHPRPRPVRRSRRARADASASASTWS